MRNDIPKRLSKQWSRYLIFIITVISVCIGHAGGEQLQEIYAAEEEDASSQVKEISQLQVGQDKIDLLFVIDFSSSMKANDSGKEALHILEACMDMMYSANTRVGFVAYNDQILDFCEPVRIVKKKKREALKDRILSIPRSGYTDLGLAMKKAYEITEAASFSQKRDAHIIVLSDGETDLSRTNQERTYKESARDLRAAGEDFGKTGVTVDCIAFGEEYGGSMSDLEFLSENTGGELYRASQSEIIIDIFEKIISSYTFSSMKQISISITGGEGQKIELPVENTFADEINILAVSSKPLQDVAVIYSGKEIAYTKSDYYFTSRISNPADEKINLQFNGEEDQEFKVYVTSYKDMVLNLEINGKTDDRKGFVCSYYFTDSSDELIDTSFYQQFQEQFEVFKKDSNSAKPVQAEMIKSELKEGRQTCYYEVSESGIYELNLRIFSDFYQLIQNNILFSIKNHPPSGTFTTKNRYLKSDTEAVFDLDTYFTDPDGDQLHYELVSLTDNAEGKLRITDSELRISLKETGELGFTVKAVDSEGSVYENDPVTISVEPFWKYYYGITIGAAITALMVILYFSILIIRKLKAVPTTEIHEDEKHVNPSASFSGKLNAYFTKLPDGMEIVPLSFALYQMRDKKVSLGRLLDTLDVPMDELDAFKIQFVAGKDKELIIIHESKSSVMAGASIVCRKLEYSIDFGNKIYITSPDGSYELELHYLSVRS